MTGSATAAEIADVLAVSNSANFFPEEDAPEHFSGETYTWTFEVPKDAKSGPGLYRLVFVRPLTAAERAAHPDTLRAALSAELERGQ